ncbi:hypothetical protein JYU34_012404 [Plutella xylostella]|uniref:Uncharacterized protein n=1 Tax=Plutella xylostella TaxID=51655 RepID=A0ABQ7QB87_PLUXY|nr:hypothetical protein JYU34_012404 [Plutella xylostella]
MEDTIKAVTQPKNFRSNLTSSFVTDTVRVYCVSSTRCGMGDGQLHNAGEAWCRWCWDQEVDTKRPPVDTVDHCEC